MNKKLCKILSVFLLTVMLFSAGLSAITSNAASESDYTATFRIATDKTSVVKDDLVTVSVLLKTNYYIYTMSLPVIYDASLFAIQNTSSTNLKSFLSFKGAMASNYTTNGNWKSPDTFYTSRNSNVSYWSKQATKDQYKIAFATWTANSSISTKAVKLTNEETIVTFVLKAKASATDISEKIFISNDFQKTKTFSAGILFAGRNDGSTFDSQTFKAVGQTIKYDGKTPIVAEEPTSSAVSINYKSSMNLKSMLDSSKITGKTIKWTSSNSSVAAVDTSGNLYAAKKGTATVTAASTDGKYTKTFDVTVNYSLIQWLIVIVLFGWIWY